MLVSTQEKRHAFERELRCSIECWFKSKGLRASNRRFGRARANRARQRGVRLEIKCGLSPDSMVEIAEAGGENVLLDVSDYA
jgi:hypothetical protein